jgi:multidrug efflux pump subunit AcrB
MNALIAWFTRNGVAANLLMVALIGAGLYSAFYKMILQEWPEYPQRVININVSYRGSTPAEVEKSIVTVIEEAVYDVDGIKEMVSNASANGGSVRLEIEKGYDLGRALDEVKNRVDAIRIFPEEAERAQVSLARSTERVITVVIAADLSEKDLKRFGERMRDEISALPGITLASLKAVRPYEVSIEVSERTLKQYGLSFETVVRSIRNSSIDLSAGSIKTDGGTVLLRTREQAYNQEEFAGIVVRTRPDGTKITLEEIATVTDGFDETPIITRFNGKRAIAIDVFRSGMQNVIELGDTVKAYIAEVQERFPEEIQIDYWADDSERIKQRLMTLKNSAITGYILVLAILALFLRPALAFWVALGIPIAFAGAFFLLPIIGVSLNMVTLFAFIVVLGIVVDDAIVTGENVFQHMQAGEDSLTAAIRGTQEVAVPVIFGVLTTIAAFYPLTTMTGWRGNVFAQIPLVVIPVLLFSLVESKLILPAHLKHLKNTGKKRGNLNPLMKVQRKVANSLEWFVERFYRPSLSFCLNHRYSTAATFVGILIVFVAIVMSGRIQYSSFPRIPRDTLAVTLIMPPGTTIEKTKAHIDRMEGHALDIKDEINEQFGKEVVANVFATSGGRPFGRGWGYAPIGVAEQGEVVVEMVPNEITGVDWGTRQMAMSLRQRVGSIPEAEQLRFAFSRGSSGISFELVSPYVDDLVAASKELQEKLKEYEGLYDIEDSFERSTEEYELKLKPEARFLGVTAINLAQQVRQAFYGAEAQRIQRERDDVRVMVRYPEAQRRTLASLDTMMIRTPNGNEVPFETVAEIVPGKSLPSIQRINRKRNIEVSADADEASVNLEFIQQEIENEFIPELLSKYQGMEYGLRGRALEAKENNEQFMQGIYFVLIVIYILLAIPFRSYFQPFIVMSVIPFGVIGAVLGHAIMSAITPMNHVISMMSILGIMALSGVVVNDSLVLVDFINRNRKKGMKLAEAVRLAGVRRFRPILLTSLTTFFGLLPLMFEESRQAQFMVPMAISLGWGIVFATFLTLILVPTVTLIFDDIRMAFCKIYGFSTDEHIESQENEKLLHSNDPELPAVEEEVSAK